MNIKLPSKKMVDFINTNIAQCLFSRYPRDVRCKCVKRLKGNDQRIAYENNFAEQK